jgi:hypothetical protein
VDQPELLRYTFEKLEGLGLIYFVVGSYASLLYGEPRFTQDIDIVVDLPAESIDAFCAAFPSPEFYLSADAVRDAVVRRFQFNVLHPASGNKIDFILARTDAWGRAQMSRRQRVRMLPDREGYAAKPEDVIIGKLLYYAEGGSEKHLRDIAGILGISGDAVDRSDVAEWAEQLGVGEVWRAVLAKVDERPV